MSTKSGEVLFCGMTDWKNVGRKAKPGMAGDPSQFPNIFVPTRVGALAGVAVTAVCGGSAASHCMVIAEDGRVFTWGRNETGQLGHGDTEDRAAPTEVKALEGIKVVGGSCGKPIDLMDTKQICSRSSTRVLFWVSDLQAKDTPSCSLRKVTPGPGAATSTGSWAWAASPRPSPRRTTTA